MVSLLGIIRVYWVYITLFLFLAITIVSLFPLQNLPLLPGSDKTHHFIAYAALMFPVALRKPKFWLLIGLFFVCWSGGIELIQPYVNRYGEWLDLAANAAGIGFALLVAQFINWVSPVSLESK
jgi:hypothetical protein